MNASELRAKIASGEIKKNTGNGGVPAGIYDCLIESAEFAAGDNGNMRGKIVAKVIDAQDATIIGRKFNCYYQTVNSTYLEQEIAELSEYCATWGIPEERIYDRAETCDQIMLNIMQEVNRLAVKGILLATIERKDSGKVNPKGKPYFYNNFHGVALNTTPVAVVQKPAVAPVAPAPAVTPVVTPTTGTAPVAPVTGKKKPWQV